MAVSDADIEFAMELFADVGPLTSRKMMGGLCIYTDDVLFALIDSDGQIFLKAKDDFAEKMAAAGARQFTYSRKDGQSHTMAYWTLPDAALDDPAVAVDWARDALTHLT